MNAVIAPPYVPVGRIKSFGAFGPKYVVGHPVRESGGDWLIEITMVETGEVILYRYARMLDDPDAR